MEFILPFEISEELNRQKDIIENEHMRSVTFIVLEGFVAPLLCHLLFIWQSLKAAVHWTGGGRVSINILVRGDAGEHVPHAPFYCSKSLRALLGLHGLLNLFPTLSFMRNQNALVTILCPWCMGSTAYLYDRGSREAKKSSPLYICCYHSIWNYSAPVRKKPMDHMKIVKHKNLIGFL